MSPGETLAAHIAALGGGLAEPVRDAARLHLCDALIGWAGAPATREGQLLRDLRQGWPGMRGQPGALLADIETGCGLARCSEVDDIHLPSGVTPGGIVVPVAVLVADAIDPGADQAAADRLLVAVAAGYEAAVRLGLSVGGAGALYRGIWPSYLAAPFAAAAVTASLLQLDATRTAHAMALALARSSTNVGHHSAATTSRWYAIGAAAASGVAAAFAARAGLTSDLRLLDGEGLAFGADMRPEALAEGLTGEPDRPFAIQATSFKPWCAARQTMTPVQALRELLIETGPGEIDRIEARVPPSTVRMVDHGVVAGNRASFLTSLPYQLAAGACDPGRLFDLQQCPDEVPQDIAALMTRIGIHADDGLAADYPAVWAARVRLTAGGRTAEQSLRQIPGDPGRPFGMEHIASKADAILRDERAAQGLLGLFRAGACPAPRAILAQLGPAGGSARRTEQTTQPATKGGVQRPTI